MLTAYFDESGIHEGADAVVLAGLVAPDEAWHQMRIAWQAFLNSPPHQLEFFHMVECEHGSGHLRKWQLSAPEVRRHIVLELTRIVGSAVLFGFHSVIPTTPWQDSISDSVRFKYDTPYVFAFNQCVQAVHAWATEFYGKSEVNFVMSLQNQYEKGIRSADAGSLPALDRENLLQFRSMKTCPPLQAADLLAYAAGKRISAEIYGRDTDERIYQVFWDRIGEHEVPVCERHFSLFASIQAEPCQPRSRRVV